MASLNLASLQKRLDKIEGNQSLVEELVVVVRFISPEDGATPIQAVRCGETIYHRE